MDSLMEALQTGSAFSRPDQRRKRQTRAAGGKFYRSAYASTKSTKKEKLLLTQLYESGEAERPALPNPNQTTAAFLLRDPVITNLASSDFTRYTTPEENQHLHKRSLLDLAMRAPKRRKFLSRVSSFNKNRQVEIRCKKIRIDRSMIEETPKREISVRRSRNFDKISNSSTDSVQRVVVSSSTNTVVSSSSYGFVIDELKKRTLTCVETRASNDHPSRRSYTELSPSLCQTILVGKALKISPVKRRRVIVGKIRRRNSIVRRAVERRRSGHRRLPTGGEGIGKSFGYLGSPTSESVSLVENCSACCTSDSTDTVSNRISRSMDDIAMRIGRTISSPLRLIRMKNLDSVARWKDVNDNNNNNLSVQYSKKNDQLTIFEQSVRSETANSSRRATELNELATQMPCHSNATVESEMSDNRSIFHRLRFSNNALKFYSMFARRNEAALSVSSERKAHDSTLSITVEDEHTVAAKRKLQKRVWQFW